MNEDILIGKSQDWEAIRGLGVSLLFLCVKEVALLVFLELHFKCRIVKDVNSVVHKYSFTNFGEFKAA